MSSFADLVREDRRLTILKVLAQLDGYTGNIHLLSMALNDLGHRASESQILADLEWMAELDYVSLKRPGDLPVATLTRRGEDIQAGLVTVAGIKRPRPE